MDVAASEFWKADINKYDLGKNHLMTHNMTQLL